jgi:hypothetical protein
MNEIVSTHKSSLFKLLINMARKHDYRRKAPFTTERSKLNLQGKTWWLLL